MIRAVRAPADTGAWSWRYAVPASDRFFNPIAQDEDVPVDGNEDRRVAAGIEGEAPPDIEITLTAEREPMPDGSPQHHPVRIRYTRILPLCLRINARRAGQIFLRLRTPVEMERADRLQCWFLPEPDLTAAGVSLWARTDHGDQLLDGDGAGERWQFCEVLFDPPRDLRILGLCLRVEQPCRGVCWMDALRVGRHRGFQAYDEPVTDAGRVWTEPESMPRDEPQPLHVTYEPQGPLATGSRLTLDSPVGWIYRNRPEPATIHVSVRLQAPGEDPRALPVECRKCPQVRWRTEASTTLDRPLPSGARLTWVLHRVDPADGENGRCDNRSFRLYIHPPGAPRPLRFVHRAVLHFSDARPVAPRRPIRPTPPQRATVAGLKPWFGYLHAHSDLSEDGRQSPDACYRYGRDIAGLDFCALSDHFWAHEPSWKWDCVQQTAAAFYRPGTFVTFAAYEWSSQDHGDRNVYFEQEGPPCPVGPIESTPAELYAQLEGSRAIIVPHSPAYEVRARGINWDFHHPGLERLVEIYSAQGSSEGPHGHPHPLSNSAMKPEVSWTSVRAALARGIQLGFVAGGDDHIRPADPDRPTGVAGIWAESLSREALFDALYRRRCFGATEAGMTVEYHVNEHWMGETIPVSDPAAPRHHAFRLQSACPIRRVEWIRNGRCRRIWFPGPDQALDLREAWTDVTPIQPIEYSYVRFFCDGGRMAWASPVFFRQIPGLPSSSQPEEGCREPRGVNQSHIMSEKDETENVAPQQTSNSQFVRISRLVAPAVQWKPAESTAGAMNPLRSGR